MRFELHSFVSPITGYPTGGGQLFVLAMSGIKTRTAPTVQHLPLMPIM